MQRISNTASSKKKDDVKYLLLQEKILRKILTDAEIERNQLSELHESVNTSWAGPEPWLHLYHCIIEEDVQEAFLNRNEWGDRQAIDARNSTSRADTFEEICCQKFNDHNFSPDTFTYPELHEDFRNSITLHGSSAPVATPSKIKEKLGSARCNVLRVINDWERSGNGSGQRAEADEEFGHVSEDQLWRSPGDNEEEFMDGDNRKNFLRDLKPHILYCWQIFDDFYILQNSLSVIPAEFSASSDSVSITNKKRKRTENSSNEGIKGNENFQKKVAEGFDKLADAQKAFVETQKVREEREQKKEEREKSLEKFRRLRELREEKSKYVMQMISAREIPEIYNHWKSMVEEVDILLQEEKHSENVQD